MPPSMVKAMEASKRSFSHVYTLGPGREGSQAKHSCDKHTKLHGSGSWSFSLKALRALGSFNGCADQPALQHGHDAVIGIGWLLQGQGGKASEGGAQDSCIHLVLPRLVLSEVTKRERSFVVGTTKSKLLMG